AVANPRRRAPRAGGAEGLDVGEREGLSGEPPSGCSLHTASEGPGTRPVSLSLISDTVWYQHTAPHRARKKTDTRLRGWSGDPSGQARVGGKRMRPSWSPALRGTAASTAGPPAARHALPCAAVHAPPGAGAPRPCRSRAQTRRTRGTSRATAS